MDPSAASVRELLGQATRIAVLTGAGISAESGIPTFRGAGGLWRDFRAEDLATPQAFARDPKLVWEWYGWRRSIVAAAQPNAGHRALAEFEQRGKDFTLITQNVDGLHDRAGSRNILKLHGDIWAQRCTGCGRERIGQADADREIVPRCPSCGDMERPGVVWFGEGLPQRTWELAQDAAGRAEVFLVIGTSATVYPAAGLAALAASSGAALVEINIAETPVSAGAQYSLRGPAAEILPQLISSVSESESAARLAS
jgi:NAD-dependent deacetylase